MRGFPPAPTAIKKLRGNPGQRRLPEHEPQPAATTAEPPRSLTGSALAIWQELAPECVRLTTLTVVDRRQFAKACRLEALADAALAKAEQTGELPTKSAREILRDADRIFARYGIGASDRTRIHVAPPKAESKWARLIS